MQRLWQAFHLSEESEALSELLQGVPGETEETARRLIAKMTSQIREYTIDGIREEMRKLQEAGNTVRLVDAEECRTLNLQDDGIS